MLNKAILVGRLVADPEMRVLSNGVNVASFRIAVDRPYSKGGERKTDFINITCWRQQAEFVCRYFQKGSDIAVDGSIQTRDYTDKDGNRRYAFEVVADRVSFVGRKNANPQPAGMAEPAQSEGGVTYASGGAGDFELVEGDDDLPF